MKAKDVMTTAVVAVGPDTTVQEIARLLVARGISAVPVVDERERVIGMVSEGDLMRRPESDTDRTPSPWLALLDGSEAQAARYLKTHGLRAREVMTRQAISVAEDASLEHIATLLERNRIKRVPVLRDGKLVGIVSRANLLHGLVAHVEQPASAAPPDTGATREAVIAALRAAGVRTDYVNVVVESGIAYLWGGVESRAEAGAIALAAERTPGVRRVENHLFVMSTRILGAMGSQ